MTADGATCFATPSVYFVPWQAVCMLRGHLVLARPPRLRAEGKESAGVCQPLVEGSRCHHLLVKASMLGLSLYQA